MCLGEIVRVMSVTGVATAHVVGERGEADVALLALDHPVDKGDWVLVHSGFALAVLTDDDRPGR